jgi:hypothetical protein
MQHRRFRDLLNRVGILRHPCDLDLILFFHRHPHALVTTERVAAYVGCDLHQVVRSLDRLIEAGLLERSQNPTHAARLYVLQTPRDPWLPPLIEIASTQEGRRQLIAALQESTSAQEPEVDARTIR